MRPDLPPIHEIWVYLAGSPLFALLLTLGAYAIGLFCYERSRRNPLANPVLLALLVVALGLYLADMPYARYFEGAQFVHFLLGTATVSLAIPIYKGWSSLRGRFGVLLLALAAGGVCSIAVAVGVLALFHADAALVRAMFAKSVTAPIAMGVAERIGASPTLTAVFAVTTGILGAVLEVKPAEPATAPAAPAAAAWLLPGHAPLLPCALELQAPPAAARQSPPTGWRGNRGTRHAGRCRPFRYRPPVPPPARLRGNGAGHAPGRSGP